MKCTMFVASLAAVLCLASEQCSAALIWDDFEGDSSGNYTVANDGSPDGTVNFGFDYIAAGIPLAPRSAAGEKKGLRITVNDTAAAVDALTAFHNAAVNGAKYNLKVDVYIQYSGTVGTTEHVHVGVGGNGSTYNQLFTPVSGSGSYIAFDGDGGSTSDYRWFLDAAHGGPTTVPNSDASYLGHGSNNTGAFYSGLFPSPPATVAGSPGNIWTTVEVDVNNGVISYSFDGQTAIQGPFTGSLDGKVSLGLADTFSGLGPVVAYFDNLVVVPEPSSIVLCLVFALGSVSVRRR